MMKKAVLIFVSLFSLIFFANAEGYKVGDKAANFSLKNVDGNMVSLSDYSKSKGVVVIFTCNHCPFAQAYESRIMDLDKMYSPKGYPVIAISPNDPELVPEDSYENMQKRAKERGYTFPYLIDETQEVYKEYGAQRTPHVFLLKKEGGSFVVKYIGTIDDNYKDPAAVTEPYVKNAIDALLAGKDPNPDFTKAIGCSIKTKEMAN